MSDKLFHCEVCNCNVSKKSKNKHLNTMKHQKNMNKDNKESEDDSNVRECVKCHKKKELDLFRNDNITCNQCRDTSNEYRRNNPEKTAEWRKNYIAKIKDDMYYCPICEYEIKKYNKAQHNRGAGHKYLVELKERGEEPEKPEKIFIDNDGTERLKCGTCKLDLLKTEWASHFLGNYHLKCKMKNDNCKRDILENQYILTDCYDCCDE